MGNKGGKSKTKGTKPKHTEWPGVPGHVSGGGQAPVPQPQPPVEVYKLTENDIDFLVSSTGQSRESIRDIYDKFMMNNPDGKLDRKEFVRLYTQLRPESPEHLDEISVFVFRAFDTDKNGTIDFNEFMIAYSLTTRGDLRKKLEYAFALYDSDNNGYLDRRELQEVVTGMLDLLGADRATHNAQQLAEECIKELDVSNDGKLTKDEFIEGLMKNYSLRSLMSPFN